MKHLIATHNVGKFRQIHAILSELEGYEFVSLNELGIQDECEETGTTYQENALLKARFYSEMTGLPTITDDSGIQVEALKDELGVQTRRWGAGAKATDEEWLQFFLKRMESETDRRAEFVCVAALFHEGKGLCFEGQTFGEITLLPEASLQAGIPLSSVFKPLGAATVYSAMDAEEKSQLSHRAKAFFKLRDYLRSNRI